MPYTATLTEDPPPIITADQMKVGQLAVVEHPNTSWHGQVVLRTPLGIASLTNPSMAVGDPSLPGLKVRIIRHGKVVVTTEEP